MPLPPVYSKLLFAYEADYGNGSGFSEPGPPTGYAWIVTDIQLVALIETTAALTQNSHWELATPNGVYVAAWKGPFITPAMRHWSGRIVVEPVAGGAFFFAGAGYTFGASVSGYELSLP